MGQFLYSQSLSKSTVYAVVQKDCVPTSKIFGWISIPDPISKLSQNSSRCRISIFEIQTVSFIIVINKLPVCLLCKIRVIFRLEVIHSAKLQWLAVTPSVLSWGGLKRGN